MAAVYRNGSTDNNNINKITKYPAPQKELQTPTNNTGGKK
jgi:hypothetical protein